MILALRWSLGVRALTFGVALWAFIGLPGAHAIVHAIEDLAEDDDDDHGDHHADEHHHHEHEGDAPGPLGHGAGALEHFGVALLAVHAVPVVPPPTLGPTLALPPAPAGVLPRPTSRPGGIRGPPPAG